MSEPYIPANVLAQADAADKFLREQDAQRLNPPESPPVDQAPAVPTSPIPQTPPPAPAPSEDFEHKYRVLQGKYNAEVPRLNESNRQLASQNADLANRLQQLEIKITEMQTPPQPPADFSKIQAEYGDDLTQVLQQQATTITKLQEVIAQLQHGQAQVVQATQESAADAFWRELRRAAPDWQQLNTDQYFLAWLGEADGLSGLTRYDTMQQAFKRLDADGVARYFASYKSTLKTAPSPQEQLQQQVSPPASGTGNQHAADNKPTFTQAQVATFFKEVALGKWNHRREEAAALERAMETAQIEGRIR